MSIRNLNSLLNPSSVAVIGASTIPRRVGTVLMSNLLRGGFSGPIMPVNPKYSAIGGVLAYPNIESLPLTPDLAVVATKPELVPGFIAELGARGTKAAIIVAAGLSQAKGSDGRTLQQMALDAARPHSLRLLGPNCLGLIAPSIGLNASFSHVQARPGNIAFLSQSGALCTAVLDWANSNNIGFSYFISLGDKADIDFGDMIDYLAMDPATRAILLYIESIRDARKFMSASRAAARNKPVLAIKAGRVAEGAKAATTHTGALAGSDEVFDAAIRRAGMLRVYQIDELFDAAETLTRSRSVAGNRLMILTNGGGPGVIATDALIASGGRLAEVGPQTMETLNGILPDLWSHGNPIDIIGDSPPDRFAAAVKIALKDPNYDALLILHVPTAIAPSEEAARAVAEALKNGKGNVLTNWLGGEPAEAARRIFAEAGIPSYDTPEKAVRAFMHLVNYRCNQEALMQTPPSAPSEFVFDKGRARAILDKVLAEGRAVLNEPEAKDVLSAYGVPVVETVTAMTAEEAVKEAQRLGFPVALKILSPEITHKSDVGGVALDLETPESVRAAAEGILQRIAKIRPNARLDGFTVQRMARRPRAFELIVGTTTDPIFGPVILFGHGGTAVELIGDRAVALPPLNMNLAGELISRTRIAKLLCGYRDHPPADLDAVKLTLLKISQLVVDFAEIMELDINPLYADERGALALDARIRVTQTTQTGPDRLAIRPYPRELEESVALPSGKRLLFRPIRPEDEPQHHEFQSRLDPQDVHYRFFGLIREIPHTEMARLTQIDYDREMAFIATTPNGRGKPETLGVVRVVCDPDNTKAEFAIIVRSDFKGQGLGRLLLEKIIRYCRARSMKEIVGHVLSDNSAMLSLAQKVGFQIKPDQTGGEIEVTLPL